MNTITIPKKIIQDDLVVMEKKYFEKLNKENAELRSAIKAVMAGESALRQNKARLFRDFLKQKFPKYAS